ncbi:MAG: DUF4065 domain-containing protein [Oceanicaulis sp.]|nr:DUF4065 domain-containing protein [Oceanicaulis sp.]
MSYDPRPVANAILDLSEDQGATLSNLALNKVLYFCHAHSLAEKGAPLVRLRFEAWKLGPVMPVIYHQFKVTGGGPINSRATRIDPASGRDIEFGYQDLGLDTVWMRDIVEQYANISASGLVALSHQPGGAWDIIWNEREPNQFGMGIPDRLILRTFLGRVSANAGPRNAH